MRPLLTCLLLVSLLHGALLAAVLQPAAAKQSAQPAALPVQVRLQAASVASPPAAPIPVAAPSPPPQVPTPALPRKKNPAVDLQPATAAATAMAETSTAEMPSAPAVDAPTPAQAAAAPDANASVVASEPRFDADYLQNPAPVYPMLSRKRREQGVVLLRAHVLPDGSTDEVQLFESSGYSRLDDAALKAVKHWRFVPAKIGSETIAAWVRVPVRFDLPN